MKRPAEGVKRVEQIEILKDCGVSLAQGSHYALPKPAEDVFIEKI